MLLAMPLSSTSTRAEVLAEYADCCGYDVDGSVELCKRFIKACRLLLSPLHTIKRSSHGGRQGNEVELDQSVIQKELDKALAWHRAASPTDPVTGGGGVVFPDFSAFRS